ncbi:MAG: hypothetical protein GXO43_03630 [Crenarchaeota archaeon]|nr:hypothetical protein [Thermoproteota archaeon]
MSKPSKSKELKIVTRHVITIDDIKKDPRKVKLLYIINVTGGISEKALQYLLYYMKEEGYDLGYKFVMLGTVPSSKEVLNDTLALRYVGLLETNPRRKLVVTSLGKEFLDKEGDKYLNDDEKDQIKKLVEELRVKIAPIDAEVELMSRPRRRRRRLF